jgi:hypothetical protein
MPRRRRGTRAVELDVDAERGLAMRILLRSPKDAIAGALAFAAVSAIIANALFLQTGHHPAPMFGSVVVMPAPGLAAVSPLPRPRPVEADAAPAEPKLALDPKPVERPAEPRPADPLTNLVKATSAAPMTPPAALRPPAPIPAPRAETSANAATRRVAAVQRALAENGYGQLRPTGTVGPETLAAIQKFERDRRIPVTGQLSDRLVRELVAVVGHPID